MTAVQSDAQDNEQSSAMPGARGGVDEIILRASGLSKAFRGFRAVSDVSLSVRRGSIHALIGPNGAGKTTLFNLLTRFIDPSAGSIHFNGRDITTIPAAEVARLGMVRSFQISSVFPQMTVFQNVITALQRRRRGDSLDFWRPVKRLSVLNDEAFELIAAVNLTRFQGVRSGELSYGRKRALELATTLALDPELLLLDEPMAGMAAEDIETTSNLIRGIIGHRTILMVEHNLSVVASLSDRITVMARGQVLAEGEYEAVSNDARVIEAYIGTGHGVLMERSPGATALKAPAAPRSASQNNGSSEGKSARSELSAAAPLLQLNSVEGWYGESHVLHGVALDARPGELITLLGRNGAGKTTTLRAIMGLLRKRTGSIQFSGFETIEMSSRAIARMGVAYVPEERGIFASLSVEENLLLPPQVQPGGLSLAKVHELFPILRERARSQGTKLSGGEQQMLSIARILRTGSKLLLLDEPTEGLAPVIVQEIVRTIAHLKTQGFTVVLVEQNLGFAQAVADRHFVIEQGKVVDVIGGGEFAAESAKVRRYLGV